MCRRRRRARRCSRGRTTATWRGDRARRRRVRPIAARADRAATSARRERNAIDSHGLLPSTTRDDSSKPVSVRATPLSRSMNVRRPSGCCCAMNARFAPATTPTAMGGLASGYRSTMSWGIRARYAPNTFVASSRSATIGAVVRRSRPRWAERASRRSSPAARSPIGHDAERARRRASASRRLVVERRRRAARPASVKTASTGE